MGPAWGPGRPVGGGALALSGAGFAGSAAAGAGAESPYRGAARSLDNEGFAALLPFADAQLFIVGKLGFARSGG